MIYMTDEFESKVYWDYIQPGIKESLEMNFSPCTKWNLIELGIIVTKDNHIFHATTRGKIYELRPCIAHKNKQFYAVVGFVERGKKYTLYAKNIIYCWYKEYILQGEDIIITDRNPLNWNDLSKLKKVRRSERKVIYEP